MTHREAPTRADVCVAAIADCFRGDGEVLANPIGLLPMIGGRLARACFEPELMMTDGGALLIANDEAYPIGLDPVVETYNPYRAMFDIVYSGRRHVIMGASQLDRYGNQNLAAIGSDYSHPRVQLLGFRGAPGNTLCNKTSYWVGHHSPQVFVEHVDVVTGIGWDRAMALPATLRAGFNVHRVITDLAVLDFATPDHSMRLCSVHPGVSVDDVRDATGFELSIPDHVPTTRSPTDDEMDVLNTHVDPENRRQREVRPR